MRSFTAGPFVVEDPMGDDHPWIVEAGKASHEWRCLAMVTADDEEIGHEEGMANAQLFAAAPDMHAALILAESFIADELETRKSSFLPDATEDEQGYLGIAETALKAVRAARSKAEVQV